MNKCWNEPSFYESKLWNFPLRRKLFSLDIQLEANIREKLSRKQKEHPKASITSILSNESYTLLLAPLAPNGSTALKASKRALMCCGVLLSGALFHECFAHRSKDGKPKGNGNGFTPSSFV